MRSILLCLLTIFFFLACKEKKMRKVVDIPERVHEFKLSEPAGKVVGDVEFSAKGAEFTDNESLSHLLFDSLKLNKTVNKNISMWLKFDGQDARVPQMIFSIKDTTNSLKRFNMWIAGRRVTAVLNSNHLWAKEYDYSKGRSKTYYDSYLLEPGMYYFLSVNYTPQKIQVYINAELYQEFENLESGDIQFHKIYLGKELTENEFRNPFMGHIRNLSFFDQTLSEDEIYSLSVETYDAISEFNKTFELKKFNFN